MWNIRLPEQVQGLPELPLGRFGRRGSKPELAGYVCGGGGVEAQRGPGVVVEGEPYGLDGAVEGLTGGEARAGGAKIGGWGVHIKGETDGEYFLS